MIVLIGLEDYNMLYYNQVSKDVISRVNFVSTRSGKEIVALLIFQDLFCCKILLLSPSSNMKLFLYFFSLYATYLDMNPITLITIC